MLESIVASRVTVHLEKHHLLCTRQFGFRPGRSAADLHLLLTSEWSAALDAGKATAVIALDIEGAFDRVWHSGLLEKLRAASVDGPLLQLFGEYLSERQLKVVVDGQESEESGEWDNSATGRGGSTGSHLWLRADLQAPHWASCQRGLGQAGITQEDLVATWCQRTWGPVRGTGLLLPGVLVPCVGWCG